MGVQELDAKEIKEVDGGSILAGLALALLAAAIYDSINDPKDYIRGVNDALHPFD